MPKQTKGSFLGSTFPYAYCMWSNSGLTIPTNFLTSDLRSEELPDWGKSSNGDQK